jgi:hypothetical protein
MMRANRLWKQSKELPVFNASDVFLFEAFNASDF